MFKVMANRKSSFLWSNMMQYVLLGLSDDLAASSRCARGTPRVSIYRETCVGVKPTHAHVGMTGVVGTVTGPDAKYIYGSRRSLGAISQGRSRRSCYEASSGRPAWPPATATSYWSSTLLGTYTSTRMGTCIHAHVLHHSCTCTYCINTSLSTVHG
jgi:hypothetical protein